MIVCRTPLLELLLVALVVATLAAGWPSVARADVVTISRDVGGTDYRPAIAESPDGGRLAAIWTQDLSVRSATSVNGGANWSDEVDLATYVGVYVDHPRVAFDAAGNLHAVWMAGQGEERTVHHRYAPAGADPARRIRLAGWRQRLRRLRRAGSGRRGRRRDLRDLPRPGRVGRATRHSPAIRRRRRLGARREVRGGGRRRRPGRHARREAPRRLQHA